MELGGGERDVQYRGDDLEGKIPSMPQLAEEIHGDDGLANGADKRGQACGTEEAGKEVVGVREDAVENYSDMWEELAYHVEGACEVHVNSLALNAGIGKSAYPIQCTARTRCLRPSAFVY